MLIVNPNVCIDRTISLTELIPGNVHRTGSAIATLGGKGVNVARVARSLDQRGSLIAFLPRHDLTELRALADKEHAELSGIEVDGSVRQATILLEATGRVTVLNEPGVQTRAADWRKLVELVTAIAPNHQSLSCSGSLPPGSAVDAYAQVVLAAKASGLRTVVDATGSALARALDVRPDVVSPNLAEAEALLVGTTSEEVDPSGTDVIERAAAAVVGLQRLGAHHVIVSAGSHGAACDSDDDVMWCPAPTVNVVSPIGAGDSLVGGLVQALEAHHSWIESVRFAIAVASASCENPLAGGVDVRRVEQLLTDLPPCRPVGAGHLGEAGQ